MPLLRATLHAGFRPRVLCVRVNSDVPPPIAFHVEHSTKAEPWNELNKNKPGHGFSGASADALFHLLSGDSAADGRDGLPPALYSLVAFEFGRCEAPSNMTRRSSYNGT